MRRMSPFGTDRNLDQLAVFLDQSQDQPGGSGQLAARFPAGAESEALLCQEVLEVRDLDVRLQDSITRIYRTFGTRQSLIRMTGLRRKPLIGMTRATRRTARWRSAVIPNFNFNECHFNFRGFWVMTVTIPGFDVFIYTAKASETENQGGDALEKFAQKFEFPDLLEPSRDEKEQSPKRTKA